MRVHKHSALIVVFALAICAVAFSVAAACETRDLPSSGGSLSSQVAVAPSALPASATSTAGYVAGDAHTHTWLSPDGARTEAEIASKAFDEYGLDWMTATDHGGASIHTTTGKLLRPSTWMWRSIRTLAYPAVLKQRALHPGKRLVQGLEWNMPALGHAGVGLWSNAATGLAEFEYRFDASDKSRAKPGWPKRNTTKSDAVYAVRWLGAHYPTKSYLIVNHPSRKYSITARDLRDLNNAAPTVAFGFEGFPGRQKKSSRGGYEFGFGDNTQYARTYGGADYFLAKVGGVWDSLLGEGRRFFTFVDSDFHDPSVDFWPGEYAKTYVWVGGSTYADLVDGLRKGNSFAVTGGIIDRLSFRAESAGRSVTMGQSIAVRRGSDVTITVSFSVPATRTGPGTPMVDHIDLIRGSTHAKAKPGTRAYLAKTNPTTKVIKRWRPSSPWVGSSPQGTTYSVTYVMRDVQYSSYLRLRGTNLALGVAGQTDAAGNPLVDKRYTNSEAKAWADCWFYANPIFIRVVE